MPAAAIIKPSTLFSRSEWASLRQRSDLIGLGLVAHAWGMIFAAMAIAIIWPNLVTWLLAIMIIGTRQLGLAVLMHEAAHGGLSTHRALGNFIGQWLCAAPVGGHLASYRDYHMQHHKYVQQDADPDLSLSAHFPITKASFRRKIIRDLSGQTFFKQRLYQFSKAFGLDEPEDKGRQNRSLNARQAVIPFLVVNMILFAGMTAFGLWYAYLFFWILPMACWFPLVTRLRNIAEHACVARVDDPLRHARTVRTNWLERLFIAPYWVHYHGEHHMFMYLPCYRLARAHKILHNKGITKHMVIADGYMDVLRSATAKAG